MLSSLFNRLGSVKPENRIKTSEDFWLKPFSTPASRVAYALEKHLEKRIGVDRTRDMTRWTFGS